MTTYTLNAPGRLAVADFIARVCRAGTRAWPWFAEAESSADENGAANAQIEARAALTISGAPAVLCLDTTHFTFSEVTA